jgi:hypothetical protein
MSQPVSASGVINLIREIDQDLPKLNSFLAEMAANPALVSVAVTLFPALKPFEGHLSEVKPWLDFFQKLADSLVKVFPTA